jgi:hypothetical protein
MSDIFWLIVEKMPYLTRRVLNLTSNSFDTEVAWTVPDFLHTVPSPLIYASTSAWTKASGAWKTQSGRVFS